MVCPHFYPSHLLQWQRSAFLKIRGLCDLKYLPPPPPQKTNAHWKQLPCNWSWKWNLCTSSRNNSDCKWQQRPNLLLPEWGQDEDRDMLKVRENPPLHILQSLWFLGRNFSYSVLKKQQALALCQPPISTLTLSLSLAACTSVCVCVRVCVRVCVHVLSRVWLVATPWTVALQVPLSMEFFRQEYWSELPFPTPGDLPDPGIQYVSLVSPALAGRFFTNCATWEAPAPVSPGESSGWLLLPPNLARSFPLSQAQRSGASSLKLRTDSYLKWPRLQPLSSACPPVALPFHHLSEVSVGAFQASCFGCNISIIVWPHTL